MGRKTYLGLRRKLRAESRRPWLANALPACYDRRMRVPAAIPEQYRAAEIERRIALIASSFERLLGRPLADPGEDIVAGLWNAPAAIVAHGIEPDPIFFFANRRALQAFESDVGEFTRMPSRLSAEAPLREERQALLDRVSTRGFIDDYSGIRITAKGRRFRIDRAIVWNILDPAGHRHGQAATFAL
jgi:hypothetical protein